MQAAGAVLSEISEEDENSRNLRGLALAAMAAIGALDQRRSGFFIFSCFDWTAFGALDQRGLVSYRLVYLFAAIGALDQTQRSDFYLHSLSGHCEGHNPDALLHSEYYSLFRLISNA